jgi:hypothetical protein
MQRVILAAVLLFVCTNGASAAAQSTTQDSPVWRWFQDCAHKTTMGVEVTVDGKSVFKSSFPICKTTNPSVDDRDHKQKIVAFTFKGGHTFQAEYHTSNAEMVEGSIWQAGPEPDDLILGVSFVSNKQNQILLNTLHICQPDRRSVEEVDAGHFR